MLAFTPGTPLARTSNVGFATVTFLGVICGFLSASFLAISYLLMRTHSLSSGWQLGFVIRAQILQGLLCLALLPLVWPKGATLASDFIIPATAAAVSFLGGQVGLLTAVRFTEASRISPLLGMKVAVVAIITVCLLGNHLNPLQWLAVALAVIGAIVLNQAGGRPPIKALLAAGGALLCYACSDVCIRQTIFALKPLALSPLHNGLLIVFLVYAIAGVIILPALVKLQPQDAIRWRQAAPFAITWLLGATFLLICFAIVGVVFGGILQSTRGIISIALGAVLATRGLEHLEQRVSRGVLGRRLAAACLMSAAIALFLLSR